MAITTGEALPATQLMRKGPEGLETLDLATLPGRVALFAVPGAFTSTCSNAHMPSFTQTAGDFRAAGVDRIICVTVNDPSVADAWAKATGAEEAGVEVWADADSAFTKAIGMDFDAPQFGMFGRSKRLSMLVRDGVVEVLNTEAAPGEFKTTGGDKLLAQL